MTQIDTFSTPDGLQLAELSVLEFVFGRNVAELQISYVPGAKCLKRDTFTEYLSGFRENDADAEQMASILLAELQKALEPRWMKVLLRQSPRNGMALEATALYQAESREFTIRGLSESIEQ